MAEYTRWYRVGTVALTNGSKIVTGTGTFWLAASLNPGDLFTVDASQFYEVDNISSNTQLTLKTAYTGASTSETDYSIVRNFTASLPAQVAAKTAELLNDFRRYIDTDMQSIHGKSAYQIACDKGYVGTESQWLESLKGLSAYAVAVANGYTGTLEQWLESLKAAGEWQQASTRLSDLETTDSTFITKTGYIHRNNIYRGKDLGPFTDDWYAEITSGRFTDMYIGDYFTIDSSHKYQIAAFYWFHYWCRPNHIVLLPMQGITEAEADPYPNTRSSAAIGTEGEEGYIPAANGEYMETNWYVNLRPKFIAQIEEFFGGANRIKPFRIMVPSGHTDWGNTTGWVELSSKAHLPTIGMVEDWHYMHPAWNYNNVWMHCCTQQYPAKLPLFRLRPQLGDVMCAETTAWRNSYNEYMHQFNDYSISWPNHTYMKGQVKPIFVVGA